MKISMLFIFSLIFYGQLIAAEGPAPETESIEKHKETALKNINDRETLIKEMKSCVSAAKSSDEIKSCRQKHKDAMRTLRAHHMDQRMENMKEKHAQMEEKMKERRARMEEKMHGK